MFYPITIPITIYSKNKHHFSASNSVQVTKRMPIRNANTWTPKIPLNTNINQITLVAPSLFIQLQSTVQYTAKNKHKMLLNNLYFQHQQRSSYNSGTHLTNLSQWIPPKNYTNTKQVTLVASSLLIHFQRITLVAPSTKQCSSSISSTNKCYKTPFSSQCQTVFSLQ